MNQEAKKEKEKKRIEKRTNEISLPSSISMETCSPWMRSLLLLLWLFVSCEATSRNEDAQCSQSRSPDGSKPGTDIQSIFPEMAVVIPPSTYQTSWIVIHLIPWLMNLWVVIVSGWMTWLHFRNAWSLSVNFRCWISLCVGVHLGWHHFSAFLSMGFLFPFGLWLWLGLD